MMSPPGGRVVHAGGHADVVVPGHLLGMDLGPAEQIVDHRAVDGEPLDLAGGDLPGDLAGQPSDLPLELPHAGLAGVAGDDLRERLVGDVELVGLHAVLLELARDEVLPGDLLLLALGVAGEIHHFHPVEQRTGNVLDEIGRRDEEHLAQVERHAEIVVHERVVLGRIEHLEQRARRIALERDAELVDLVEQEDGILGAGLLHPLNDAAGHGADVGAAVARECRPRRARHPARCARTCAPSPGRSTWPPKSCRRPEDRRTAGSGRVPCDRLRCPAPARLGARHRGGRLRDVGGLGLSPSSAALGSAARLFRGFSASFACCSRSWRTARNSSTRSFTSPRA